MLAVGPAVIAGADLAAAAAVAAAPHIGVVGAFVGQVIRVAVLLICGLVGQGRGLGCGPGW
jgi:hypothetical protein